MSLAIHGVWAAHASILDIHHSNDHHEQHLDVTAQPFDAVISQLNHTETTPCSTLEHEVACCAMSSGYYLSENYNFSRLVEEYEVLTPTHPRSLKSSVYMTLLRPPQL